MVINDWWNQVMNYHKFINDDYSVNEQFINNTIQLMTCWSDKQDIVA